MTSVRVAAVLNFAVVVAIGLVGSIAAGDRGYLLLFAVVAAGNVLVWLGMWRFSRRRLEAHGWHW